MRRDRTHGLRRREVLKLLGAGGIGLLASAQVATRAPAAPPKKGGLYRLGRVQDILNFNPSNLSQGNEPMIYQIYDTLVRIGDDFQLEPRLAESWKFSPDYLTMTLTLRQGVKFHSGREFTAEDVIGTFALYADKQNGANLLPFARSIKSPKALDRHRVELHFDQPPGTLFDGLDLLFIVDPTNPGGLKNKPNGTGPFRLERWQPNEKSVYRRFEQYRQPGLPYLDTLEVSVWPDPQTMVVALESGSIDLASPVSPLEAKRLSGIDKYQLTKDKLGLVFDVVMNTTAKPFNDKRVRQAVSWAVNRQRFCDTYLRGLVQPWSLPWPPFSPAYDADLNKVYSVRDPIRARQLLKEAGYEHGFDVKLLCTRSRPGYAELAEQLQADLKEVGIRVSLDLQDEAAWRPKFIEGNFQIATHTFGRNNKVPASMFQQAVVWRTDKNSAQFTSERFTELVQKASAQMEPERARPYLKEINQLIIDECFTLCIAPQPRPNVQSRLVQGYQSNLDSYPMLESVWFDR